MEDGKVKYLANKNISKILKYGFHLIVIIQNNEKDVWDL